MPQCNGSTKWLAKLLPSRQGISKQSRLLVCEKNEEKVVSRWKGERVQTKV